MLLILAAVAAEDAFDLDGVVLVRPIHRQAADQILGAERDFDVVVLLGFVQGVEGGQAQPAELGLRPLARGVLRGAQLLDQPLDAGVKVAFGGVFVRLGRDVAAIVAP